MKTPETSKLFNRWKNPTNGVESLILTERAAPVQSSFYFTNPSFTADGRRLWVSCAFPPPGGRYAAAVLGVTDFERDELRVYPETQHPTARPLVDEATGEIYRANEKGHACCARVVSGRPPESAQRRVYFASIFRPTFKFSS